ncbi:extracellular solute-binding protein [Loktanella fryxellensis]|uniref:Extracellular solute-binding protein n=1 Tax=Loktanella fryxellensis TaxID=245187 RepID=A0A1H8CDT3_9RHOB|nr:extracellular solute-binding protein [Loktanella fryxellensis]SEM93170.1 extracellular solute-binding protein [Loktanella fryxellensis]
MPNDIRFPLNDDNHFAALRNMWSDFRNDLGRKSSFDMQRPPALHPSARATGQSTTPAQDVMAVNMPWLGEFAEQGLLAPLVDLLTDAPINAFDFHPSAWETGNWNGTQYGIPLYCTIDILAVRRDLVEQKVLAYPATFDDTIRAARVLHRPGSELYGIARNGQRGMPIAHSFMFFLAACQRTITDMPLHNQDSWRYDRFELLKLQVDTPDSLEVIDCMKPLVEVSPSDIATMDWERRIACFMSGQAGMACCWTMRAARFEHELSSRVARRVAYLSPPGPGCGFLMTIPAPVDPARQQQIIDAVAWMVSPEAMKAHVKNGAPVAPRLSVCADPQALASSPHRADGRPDGPPERTGDVVPPADPPRSTRSNGRWVRQSTTPCSAAGHRSRPFRTPRTRSMRSRDSGTCGCGFASRQAKRRACHEEVLRKEREQTGGRRRLAQSIGCPVTQVATRGTAYRASPVTPPARRDDRRPPPPDGGGAPPHRPCAPDWGCCPPCAG